VIGTGGAANAAIFALLQHEVEVNLYSRNPNKAESLSQRFNISCMPLDERNLAGYDIVINATPLGSLGKEIDKTPLSAHQLQRCRLVYDLVYNPIETRFMKEGREAGCDVLGGLEMLVAQARLQFKLLTKKEVSYELMYEAGHSALTQNFTS
jgi:shikimate dehydrogenase